MVVNTFHFADKIEAYLKENDCFGMDVEISDEDFDTFGGYVLSLLGAIPEDDATFTVEDDDISVEVTGVKEHRIEKTIVTKKQKA